MKVVIFPNLNKLNCHMYTVEACEIFFNNDVLIYMDIKYSEEFKEYPYIKFGLKDHIVHECDFIVAVGGDGTILECSGMASRFNKPVLGINCGRLGFMASLEHSEMKHLNDFSNGKFTLNKRMMIDAEVIHSNGERQVFTALNDVVVSKDTGCKIADFNVSKNGVVISSLRADGLIFSTPTGATAYSLSAGGPIIEPSMECIEFTQICPHSLFARSMMFLSDSVLDVKFKTAKDAKVVLAVDGNDVLKLSKTDLLKIYKSESFIELVDIQGGSFFLSVNAKLMQPLKEMSEDFSDEIG